MKNVELYIERLNKITKKKYVDDYKNIKKEIFNKCINDRNYTSIDYINLEIERMKLKLGMENSQYISVIYSVSIFIIPVIVTLVFKFINIDLNKVSEYVLRTLVMYLIIAITLFSTFMINKTRTFKCCTIYLNVLQELKKSLEDKERE